MGSGVSGLNNKGALGRESIDSVIESLKNKYGVKVNISDSGNYQKEAEESVKHFAKLMDEYDSTAISYGIAPSSFGQEAGQAYMLNGKTAVLVQAKALKNRPATDELGLGENQYLGLTYHEFAHSLSQSREKVDNGFWKEIRALKKEYQSQINTSDWSKKKISSYALKDVDEFFAEGFTQAKLAKNPSNYSNKILEITNKYFKKK